MPGQVEPNMTSHITHRPASLWDLPPELFAPGLYYPRSARYTFVIDRLWAHVVEGDGCWPWRGERCPKGYGRLVIDPSRLTGGKRLKFRAHRCVWESIHGPVPDGLSVLHRCDNRVCCRPDHLFLGTMRDNAHDMMRKGRGRSRAGTEPKLTADQVRTLRARLAGGHGPKRVSRECGVKLDTVRRIRRGAAYAWVPDVAGEPAADLAA